VILSDFKRMKGRYQVEAMMEIVKAMKLSLQERYFADMTNVAAHTDYLRILELQDALQVFQDQKYGEGKE
jgi:hypothetical protein